MKQEQKSNASGHIQGLTVFAALGELDPALVAEAEVDAALLSGAAVATATVAATGTPAGEHLFTIDEGTGGRRRSNRPRRPLWKPIAACLAGLVVLVGIAAMIRHGGGLLPGLFEEPGENPSDTTPPYSALEVLLPGKVPFAPTQGDFTISVAPMIAGDANGLSVTMQAGSLGAPLSNADGWQLENLTDPTWNGEVCFDALMWNLDGTEGKYTQTVQELGLIEPLTPGIYRLHAVERTEGGGYASVAYCEFAVDDEKGTYRTWTEADFADAPVLDATYTISTNATVPYGSSEIRVTATAKNGGHSLIGPATFRLVKIDGEPTGAGACFVGKEGLNFASKLDAAPNSNAVASAEQVCQIINPAACTPGRYRIYNVADDGTVYATCEFEIVGDPLGWPGEGGGVSGGETHPFPEAEEKPFTITATIDHYDDGKTGYLSITYKGVKQGEPILHPSLNFRVVKIDGVDNPAEWNITTTEEAIELVMPTERNDYYAVFTKSHIIMNAEAMLPGVYRVYALTYANEYIDYYDVVFGAEDIYPEAAEKPYTFEAEIAPSKYSPDRMYLSVTYTATEKGVMILPNLTGIIIHKIYGEADEQGPYTDMNEYGLAPVMPEPDEYCVLQDSRTIYNLEHMKPGVYRIYSLNEARTAYIDYCDVMWNGYTVSDTKETETAMEDGTEVYEPSPIEPIVPEDFTISTDYEVYPYGFDTITVIYKATRPGEAFTMGSMRLISQADGQVITLEHPEDDALMIPEDPSTYLEYRRTFIITDYESLTEGWYYLIASVGGRDVAMTEMYVSMPSPD